MSDDEVRTLERRIQAGERELLPRLERAWKASGFLAPENLPAIGMRLHTIGLTGDLPAPLASSYVRGETGKVIGFEEPRTVEELARHEEGHYAGAIFYATWTPPPVGLIVARYEPWRRKAGSTMADPDYEWAWIRKGRVRGAVMEMTTSEKHSGCKTCSCWGLQWTFGFWEIEHDPPRNEYQQRTFLADWGRAWFYAGVDELASRGIAVHDGRAG